MSEKWRAFFRRGTTRVAVIPRGMRIYAIGDIHGRADLLSRMHRAIMDHAAGAPPAQKHLVYLGDYVDRGMEVKETLELLSARSPEGFTPVFLKGNHEDMLLNFIANADSLGDWLAIGGRTTLLSYGVAAPAQSPGQDRSEQLRRKFLKALPESHHDFLSSLRTHYRAGDYLFVHAGIRPGVPLTKQDPEDFLWIREPFLSHRRRPRYRVVHGHSITNRPEILPDRIGVDSGAYATGRLTCVILERDRAEFLAIQAHGNAYAMV